MEDLHFGAGHLDKGSRFRQQTLRSNALSELALLRKRNVSFTHGGPHVWIDSDKWIVARIGNGAVKTG